MGDHNLQVGPHADGVLAEKDPRCSSIHPGALRPRMGPLRLEMNLITLRAQPGMEFVFVLLGLHTPRGYWRMITGGSIVYAHEGTEIALRGMF